MPGGGFVSGAGGILPRGGLRFSYPGITPILYPDFFRGWHPVFLVLGYPCFCYPVTCVSLPGVCYQSRDVVSGVVFRGLYVTCDGSLLPRF